MKQAEYKLMIEGGRSLNGKVQVSGAKNASLAHLCAATMARDPVILENVPDIKDIRVVIEILQEIGCEISWLGPGELKLFAPEKLKRQPPFELVRKLRASNLLLGPLIARYGSVQLALPGGCNIGVRPMDLHFKGLSGLGTEINVNQGVVESNTRGLQGSRIYMDFPSVGATENIMMAACMARGQTVLENVAKEPEVVDLANFLNCMGVKVRGAGTDIIKIDGNSEMGGCSRYSIIPDRIEAGTFMVAAAATGGNVEVENVIPFHLEPISAKLREAGVEVIELEESIKVRAGKDMYPVDLKTLPYPGFPTDMQSQFMSMLCAVPGTSVIVENIFENRFQIVDELKRMGANIKVEGRAAIVEGPVQFQGAHVKATDLRAGAALVVAGLMAEGCTQISNVKYIDRGYYLLQEKMTNLGAAIWRE
ncbi:MAG: UDP-N-acetylglucosamine 1-carboxyvinyltransferase [Clostridiales bacterium]|nr:UDP-N-acetylglucosamine 1-carboxyvinyltransferase [Clostridiales bacterium]MCF8022504.1 UDP-N-acetylglucosamine 1-carboxyvinyltransferase [Clostridiales bacterium]